MRILGDNFFNRPAPAVARGLIGKCLVRELVPLKAGRRRRPQLLIGIITETEAYEGFRDKASHAHRGKTPRNFPMFGPAGRWYVYFVYGNHWMLNIVTGKAGYPAAVLIRGIRRTDASIHRQNPRFLDGPAKLTKFFKIDKRFNNKPAVPKTGLWISAPPKSAIENLIRQRAEKIKNFPRVGVSYAGPYWSRRKWRFCLK